MEMNNKNANFIIPYGVFKFKYAEFKFQIMEMNNKNAHFIIP